MKRRQGSLSEAWSQYGPSSSKKSALGLETQRQMNPDETAPVSSVVCADTAADPSNKKGGVSDGVEPNPTAGLCQAMCCESESKCFQPVDKATLSSFAKND